MPAHSAEDFDASARRILRHIQALEGERHPVTNPDGLRRAAAYIGRYLRALGYNVLLHRFQEDGGSYHNIIAERVGLTHWIPSLSKTLCALCLCGLNFPGKG